MYRPEKTYHVYKPRFPSKITTEIYGQPVLTKADALERPGFEDPSEITLYDTGMITSKQITASGYVSKVIQTSPLEYKKMIELKNKIIHDGLKCNCDSTWWGRTQPFLYFYDIDKTHMVQGECLVTISTGAHHALIKMLDTIVNN